MKIIILGSCISSDAFHKNVNFSEKEELIMKRLFCRTSLISQHSASLNIELSDIQGLGPFETRFLYEDINKGFYRYLNTTDLTDAVLLLDFIDERFDMLKSGTTYITKSNEFLKLTFQDMLAAKMNAATSLQRLSDEVTALWKENCLSFAERIKPYFPENRIILHKAFWAEKYLDSGKVNKFTYLPSIRQHNKLLGKYYQHFEKIFPRVHLIDMTKKGFIADNSHEWGLAPFHYEQHYYENFMICLNKINRTINK
ncbi:MAG: DUF6270 domain-containing protein [Bacteroidota bacterium]